MLVISLLTAAIATISPPASTTAPAKAAAKPDLGVIAQQNPFDPKRKAWLIPQPPAPPPPALTEADVKIHGVIVAGSVKRAVVELSGKLAPAAIPTTPGLASKSGASRPYRTVTIGDDIGGYRITDITPQALVFEFSGQQSTLAFNLAKGRSVAGGSVAPPSQMAVVLAAPTPTLVNEAGVAETVAPAAPPMAASDPGNVVPNEPVAEVAAAAPPAPTQDGGMPTGAAQSGNGSGMSLLEAIQRAKQQQAQQQQPSNTQPVTNPFAPQIKP